MSDNIQEVAVCENSLQTTPFQLLKRFHLLQQERVETYSLFEEGFSAYLQGHPNYNFPLYRQLVHEITETFNKISKDIIAIKCRLCDDYRESIVAGLIGKIQDQEQKKLEMTVENQISRQNELDKPEEPDHKEKSREQKARLQEIVGRINELLEELKYECEDIYNGEEDDRQVDR